MTDDFDVVKADKSFAKMFFNDTWTYLDKAARAEEETEAMIHCCHASFHHWSRVADKTPTNAAIGYWQLSRAYAVAGRAEEAGRYGLRCLAVAETATDDVWVSASAHEALARVAALKGDRRSRDEHLSVARAIAATVTDEETRKILAADIDSVP